MRFSLFSTVCRSHFPTYGFANAPVETLPLFGSVNVHICEIVHELGVKLSIAL